MSDPNSSDPNPSDPNPSDPNPSDPNLDELISKENKEIIETTDEIKEEQRTAGTPQEKTELAKKQENLTGYLYNKLKSLASSISRSPKLFAEFITRVKERTKNVNPDNIDINIKNTKYNLIPGFIKSIIVKYLNKWLEIHKNENNTINYKRVETIKNNFVKSLEEDKKNGFITKTWLGVKQLFSNLTRRGGRKFRRRFIKSKKQPRKIKKIKGGGDEDVFVFIILGLLCLFTLPLCIVLTCIFSDGASVIYVNNSSQSTTMSKQQPQTTQQKYQQPQHQQPQHQQPQYQQSQYQQHQHQQLQRPQMPQRSQMPQRPQYQQSQYQQSQYQQSQYQQPQY